MELATIVQHPTYTKLLKFLASSACREKLLRLLQFAIRYLRFHLSFRSIGSAQLSSTLANIQQTLMISRKPLRALKPLAHFKSMVVSLADDLDDPVIKYCKVVFEFSMALYFTYDSIQWAKLLGLAPNVGNVGKTAAGWWTVALTSTLLRCARQLWIVAYRRRNSEGKDLSANIFKANGKVLSDTVKTVLDLSIAYSIYRGGPSKAYGNAKYEGLVALSGIVTSVIGIDELWKALG